MVGGGDGRGQMMWAVPTVRAGHAMARHSTFPFLSSSQVVFDHAALGNPRPGLLSNKDVAAPSVSCAPRGPCPVAVSATPAAPSASICPVADCIASTTRPHFSRHRRRRHRRRRLLSQPPPAAGAQATQQTRVRATTALHRLKKRQTVCITPRTAPASRSSFPPSPHAAQAPPGQPAGFHPGRCLDLTSATSQLHVFEPASASVSASASASASARPRPLLLSQHHLPLPDMKVCAPPPALWASPSSQARTALTHLALVSQIDEGGEGDTAAPHLHPAQRRHRHRTAQEGVLLLLQHVPATPPNLPHARVANTTSPQVIKALYDYTGPPDAAPDAGFLSFSTGDFLHVVDRENDKEWYEACNPLHGTRGLVPVTYFDEVGKTVRDSSSSTKSVPQNQHDSGYQERGISSPSAADTGMQSLGRMSRTMGKGSGAMVYGIVMYDFKAERPDELEAKEGEAIIVIAQSNPEWFVAKPITRLGGPGLIPVSFIEIRDMTTGQAVPDPHEAVRRAGVPKVEEWKKMAADYKNGSIPLGKLETNSQQTLQQGMERMSLSGKSQAGGAINGGYGQGSSVSFA